MPKHARDPRLREWLQAAGLSTQRTEEVLVIFEEQGVDSVADVHLFEQQPEFDQLITASVVRAKVHAAAKRELEKVADTGNGAEGEAESSSDDEDDREDEDTIGSLTIQLRDVRAVATEWKAQASIFEEHLQNYGGLCPVQIHGKTLTGNTVNIKVDPNLHTVASLKFKIQDIEGIPISQQRLIEHIE